MGAFLRYGIVLLLAMLGASAALAQSQNVAPPPPVVLLPQTSIANVCTLGCDSTAMFCLNTCVQPPPLRRRPISNAVSVALRRSSSAKVVCCDEKGVAAFQMLRHRRNEPKAFLYAFDLLELNGTDLRREPIEVRKATLASILRKARHGVRLNEHLEHPEGAVVFQHACKMGLEGIVSKRLGSRYRSGRSPDWLKFKNPEAPAVKREAEEIGQMRKRQRLESARGLLPQPSPCVIQCLGSQ
jgi:hypothetical protein